MVYVRGCRGNPSQWMNYIICKTFWRQDEVLVDKQWDLKMGRKGGRGKREGQEREKKRDSMKLLPTI